jgi:hypothetical protein
MSASGSETAQGLTVAPQFICTPQQAAAGVRYTFDSPRAPLSTPGFLHFGHPDVAPARDPMLTEPK